MISETMYKRAHDPTLDSGERKTALAEALVQAGKDMPDESKSDVDVRKLVCTRICDLYKVRGRFGKALFWNEERLKLMTQDDDPKLLHDARVGSIRFRGILRVPGQSIETLFEIHGELKQICKQDAKSERARSYSFLSDLERRTNPTFKSMSAAAVAEERAKEASWDKQFYEFTERDPNLILEHAKAKEMLKWNNLLHEGAYLLKRITYWAPSCVCCHG